MPMSKDEILAKLREAGVSLSEDWTTSSERKVRSPIAERQKETLRKLQGLLETQIEIDQLKVAELHATLQKVKNGGG